jgi:hypothetical protein
MRSFYRKSGLTLTGREELKRPCPQMTPDMPASIKKCSSFAMQGVMVTPKPDVK